jgi:hypothetical protein
MNVQSKREDKECNGAYPECGPLAEDSASKLKRAQLIVCTRYCVGYVQCSLPTPPLAAESCADWDWLAISVSSW